MMILLILFSILIIASIYLILKPKEVRIFKKRHLYIPKDVSIINNLCSCHFPTFNIVVRTYDNGVLLWGKLSKGEASSFTLECCKDVKEAMKGTKEGNFLRMGNIAYMRCSAKFEDEITVNIGKDEIDVLDYNEVYTSVLRKWIKL